VWFEVLIGILALASFILIARNMRVHGFQSGLRARVMGCDEGSSVEVEGKRLRPIIYVSEDILRDDTGTLGERLANLARSVRMNVTYATSLFHVERSALLARLEEEIKKAEFGYQATRHVRYSERLRFLKSLYNDVARSHAPYAYRYVVVVWAEEDRREEDARAEAFRSMVEAEAGIRLRRVSSSILEALIPGEDSPLLAGSQGYASLLANIVEPPGIVVGRDPEGRIVALSWPHDFETHVGIFGPTGRGKTVLLFGISSQLGARSDSMLDPFMVAVVDPKGDLAKMLAPLASYVYRVGEDSCIQLPRLEGLAEELLAEAGVEGRIRLCEGSLLRRGLVVFDLSGLPNEARDAAASAILVSLTVEASEGVLPGRVVLVVDEAWRLVQHGYRHMILALREGRSRGLYVVYATQNPDDLPDPVVSNTGTLFVFGGYTRAYTEAARRLGLDDARLLLRLPLGTAMLKLKDTPPLQVRVLGFHEYVKREAGTSGVADKGRVVGVGQEAEAAESRQG